MQQTSEVPSDDLATLRAAVGVTHRRADLAIGAIALVGASQVAEPLLWLLPSALLGLLASTAAFAVAIALGGAILHVVAAVLFCRWLYRAYGDSALLGGGSLEGTPGQAVASFFIPFICLYRPFQIVRALHVSSDPSPLPDPPQYRSKESEVLYRSNEREPIAAPRWELWFPVRSWWALYMGAPLITWVLGMVGAGAAVTFIYIPVSAASVVTAIQVIRSIRARQEERLRRLEAAAGLSG